MKQLSKDIYNNFQPWPLDLRGWNGDLPIFSELIAERRPKTIIEVGSWKGLSAITMAKAVQRLGLDCKIYCADTWLGAYEFWGTDHTDAPERNLHLRNGYPQVYYQFISNVIHSKVTDYILPLPLDSKNACRYLKYIGVSADLIYIDASHEYEDVLWDVKNYWELVANEGIIFGDDYNNGAFEVKKAVDQFGLDYGKVVRGRGEGDGFWQINKSPKLL